MTRRLAGLVAPLFAVAISASAAREAPQNFWDPNWALPETLAREIEAAVPGRPCVPPLRPRKLLVYGRRPTHPGSVVCCFKAVEVLGKKTGAFETVASGDPNVFLPENLAQFDAVLMNNTHESHPMLPIDFDRLGEAEKSAAREKEAILQKSLLEFVGGGKGIVGIHAAVATGWKEYLAMMGGPFGSHITTNVWIKANEPAHPLCTPLSGQGLEIFDEVYVSDARDFSKGLRVLLSLDLEKMPDPGKRDDGNYSVSWIRSHGKGRVFYCSLGHEPSTYTNPTVLRHYLAGIQFALGDLKADAASDWGKGDIRGKGTGASRVGHITAILPEAASDRERRHKKIAERRLGPALIVHRGAWALAPENTLEAYAAAMDHGADGCEIDIRRAADGVLVMFHDDGIERMTEGFGRLNEHTYQELLDIEFRPGLHAGPGTRIPTFAAVLELARQRSMLLHLDIKEPGLEDEIARMLDAADVWDHVVEINTANAAALRNNPKARRLTYKAFGWQEGRMDLNPDRVRTGLAKPGAMIMVDDPRVTAQQLNRRPTKVALSDRLYAPVPSRDSAVHGANEKSLSPAAYLHALTKRVDIGSAGELAKMLAAAVPEPADSGEDAARVEHRTRRILERAWAARMIAKTGERSASVIRLLERAITDRTGHQDRAYDGLDGAIAARALGALGATESVPFLVQTFLAVESVLQKNAKQLAAYPHASGDFRLEAEILYALGELNCETSTKFLSGYLARDVKAGGGLWGSLFEAATRARLRHPMIEDEVEGLLRSANPTIRGTAMLVCLDDQTPDRAGLLGKVMPWTRELPRAGE